MNVGLRGGVALLLVFAAALLLRDQWPSRTARLGALFAVGVAAHTLHAVPGLAGTTPWWHGPVSALAAGNALVFWLFACALFRDGPDAQFALRAWHAVVWLALALVSVLNCLLWLPGAMAAAPVAGTLLRVVTVGFAVLAAVQSAVHWKDDLVEGRRRLRVIIIVAGSAYTLFNLALRLVLEDPTALPEWASTIDAAVLGVLAVSVLWPLLHAGTGGIFDIAPELGSMQSEVAQPLHVSEDDVPPCAELKRLMQVERVYRQEGLSIGVLAAKLGVPEYRLRRLINQRLGHRNFTAFLNEYRLAEVQAALADPARDEPVLTLALSAGFQSIGPFNRAFKAATGRTPTEYRAAERARAADEKHTR